MKKMLSVTVMLAASTCALSAGVLGRAAWAQPPGGELTKQDFENEVPGWIKFAEPENAAVQVGIAREPENVHAGAASLRFSYVLQPRQITALALENTAPLAQANTISFWAKSSAASTMTFAVQERGGGLWTALFNLPAGKWQRVELAVADFSTGLDPNAAPDQDGKLSLGNIEWAGIGDFSQYLLQEPNAALQQLFGVEPGPRTLWLDDLAFDPTRTAAPEGDKIVVDNFAAPQTAWIHLAGTDIAREERDVDGAKMPGLSVSYATAAGKFGGVLRRVNSAAWAGATQVSLRLASTGAVNLALQMEEKGGGKYYVPIIAPGDGDVHALSFGLSQFKASDDSKDANGKLDMEQVQQILLIDLAGADPAAKQAANALWVGDVSVSK